METTKKKMPLWAKIVLIALAVLLGLVLLALAAVRGYVMLPVSDYYDNSEKAFRIPGLSDNYVPQGMAYDEANGVFILSGYMSDDTASPIYLVDDVSGELKTTIRLMKENGDPFTGHAGGVDFYNNYLYVAGGGHNCIYVFPYDEILAAGEYAEVSSIGKFSLKASDTDYIDASYVTVYNGILTVGEFYWDPAYPTEDSHKFTTPAGDYNQSLAIQFKLSEGAEFGIEPKPLRVFSLTDKVQGITFSGGEIWLSTSYSVNHSYIHRYDATQWTLGGEIELLGQSVPLIYLDSASKVASYKIPPMSEEMVMINNQLYVLCESACNKYIFGKFADAFWCYRTDFYSMEIVE